MDDKREPFVTSPDAPVYAAFYEAKAFEALKNYCGYCCTDSDCHFRKCPKHRRCNSPECTTPDSHPKFYDAEDDRVENGMTDDLNEVDNG